MKTIERILKRFVFSSLYASASDTDLKPLDDNISKHARALVKCLMILPCTYLALLFGGSRASDIVLYVSLAAQIAGLAWFVISFAALPERHIKSAMLTTESMFTSFLAGVAAIIVLATVTAPFSLLVIVPIYWWLYRAAALYDSADLLKAGKDEQELKAAQAIQRMEPMIEAIAIHMGYIKKEDIK